MLMRFLAVTLCWFTAASAAAADWPTLHGDLTRSGFYSSFPKGPLKLVWRKELHQELTAPRAEIIVADGLAFMGTYAGNLHAWNAANGADKWLFKTGGPIGHSPMYSEGTIYLGSMDRRLYAVATDTGQARWSFECAEGISASPVVFRGLVLFGARDGIFYALKGGDGKLAWQFQTGAPILNSASISEDGRRVLFASEDMHVVPAAIECRRQFRNMRRDTAHGHGVERFPSEHRDPHREISLSGEGGRAGERRAKS